MHETELTRRQRDIYTKLLEREADGHPPPTLAELCRSLGLRSRGSLHKHVQALVEAGLVAPLRGRHRGIRLVMQPAQSASEVPFLGRIAAGRPVEAFENPESVEVPAFLRGTGPVFVLEVKGDSMREAGILDGDLLVIERRSHARNRQIVVALVNGTETTLKRIEQRPGRVVLHPENPAFEPMIYAPEQVEIQGVLIGQMRAYR